MKQPLLRTVMSLIVGLICQITYGQAPLQNGVTIYQDFDNLAPSATSSLPSNWTVSKSNNVRDVNFSSAVSETERIGGDLLPSNAANGIYNFGAGAASTATDRAIGFISSGTATKSGNIFFQGVNSSSEMFTSMAISFQVEKYREGANLAGYTIELFYSKNGTNWISAGENFKTSFPSDATNAGFEVAPGLTIPVAGNLEIEIAPNESLYLAWNYSVTAGSTTTNSQGLAVDNISITPQVGEFNGRVSTPSFDPFPGTFSEVQQVQLATTPPDASIYYTLDGSEPSFASSLYTGPIEVNNTVTIKAIGIRSGYDDSPVIEGEFIIDIPEITPAALPYAQAFTAFSNLSTPLENFGITNEWSFTGSVLTYGGVFGTGTGGGFRGGDVLGYQHTGTTNTINATLTLQNTTSQQINELEVSYVGKVERVDQGRSPEWTVFLNGQEIPQLSYSTINGVDLPVSYIITGLSINPGEDFQITWSSQRGDGSGSSRQIGIDDVEVKIAEIPDTPLTFVENFDNSTATTSYANGSFVGENNITWEYFASRNEGDYPINGMGIMLRRASDNSRLVSQGIPGGIRSFSVDMRKAFTGSAPRQIGLYVNDVEVARSEVFGNFSGADATIKRFEVNGLSIEGDVIIEIRNLTEGQITIDNIQWTTLQSFSGPMVDYLFPANRAEKVALDTDLKIGFNNTILKGTGYIEIYKQDGTLVQSLDVNSREVVISDALVDIKVNTFEGNTQYYVLIQPGAFVDESGQDFIGFSSAIEWTFETLDPFNIQENFNTSCPEGLPFGWEAVNLLGDQMWECTTFGRAGTSPTASAPFGLQISGFSGGALDNEDWLISPAYDLTAFDYPLLSFWSRGAFTGPRLKLMISTDYTGGDPTQATWTELSDRFDNGNVWTFSEQINLEDFKFSNVRVAFAYKSNPEEGAARWTLDDFALVNSIVGPAPFLSNSIGNIDYLHFGVVPVGAVSSRVETFRFSLSDGTDELTISSGEGFEFSKNGMDFHPVLTYTAKEAAANNQVSVRFSPTKEGAFSGAIHLESGDIRVSRGFLTGATVEKDGSFDVVTWNIEWFGSTESGQGPADVDQQLQNVKTIIEDLDADVYAFQEITGLAKFDELVTALDGYEAFVSPAASQGADQFEGSQKLVFLYKKATVEPITTRVLLEGVQPSDLVNYPGPTNRFWASGRLPFLMEVKATIKGVQQNINLINVHARSNGGGESAANQRYAMRKYDVNVLKDSLDHYYADVPLIMLGDYNDDLDETVADQNAPTVNTTETSYISYINDPENYIPITLNLSNAGLRTFIAFENVIDHMIISNELRDNWLVNSERIVVPFDLVANYQNTTSDHLPVKVRFTFKCDLEAGQIIGNPEVCGGENSAELMIIGGVFENILGWEVSNDNGGSWSMVPESAGQTEIEVRNIAKTSLYRAVLASDGCEPIATEPYEILVNQLPQPVVYFDKGELHTIEGNYTYYWYKNGSLINTTVSNATRINGAGQYQVTIIDENGCQSTSENYRFPQQLPMSQLKVFPNPAVAMVKVAIKKGEGIIQIGLMSRTGLPIQVVYTSEGYAEFDVSSLAKGVYLVVVTDRNGQRVVERLLVE